MRSPHDNGMPLCVASFVHAFLTLFFCSDECLSTYDILVDRLTRLEEFYAAETRRHTEQVC